MSLARFANMKQKGMVMNGGIKSNISSGSFIARSPLCTKSCHGQDQNDKVADEQKAKRNIYTFSLSHCQIYQKQMHWMVEPETLSKCSFSYFFYAFPCRIYHSGMNGSCIKKKHISNAPWLLSMEQKPSLSVLFVCDPSVGGGECKKNATPRWGERKKQKLSPLMGGGM